MRLTADEAQARFVRGRVARLATVGPAGMPHLVPIVFAVRGDTVYSMADPKPKRSLDLLRHRHIAGHPQVSLLVDEYDEAWERLWWVRADGLARVWEEGEPRDTAIELLREKYPQYERWTTPFGAATVIHVERWAGWAMTR